MTCSQWAAGEKIGVPPPAPPSFPGLSCEIQTSAERPAAAAVRPLPPLLSPSSSSSATSASGGLGAAGPGAAGGASDPVAADEASLSKPAALGGGAAAH